MARYYFATVRFQLSFQTRVNNTTHDYNNYDGEGTEDESVNLRYGDIM